MSSKGKGQATGTYLWGKSEENGPAADRTSSIRGCREEADRMTGGGGSAAGPGQGAGGHGRQPQQLHLPGADGAASMAIETPPACLVPPDGHSPPAHPHSVLAGTTPRHADSTNPVMQGIHRALPRIAASSLPVLLRGESGVGKEVIAREIHALSPRAGHPLVKLNCAALPSELLESELFGYERGAFTGAYKTKPGLLEQADKGTLLLDEMGEMDVRLQAKLLHVLQDGVFHRLGGRDAIRVDARIIAATNCDLELAVQERRFRADLYYRLRVIELCIPPLRERKDEIPGLVACFLQRHAAGGTPVPEIGAQFMQLFLDYDWPGNIRELENAICRLVVLQDPSLLIEEFRTPRHGPNPSRAYAKAPVLMPEPLNATARRSGSYFEEVEHLKYAQESQAIAAALETTYWNRKEAAKLLGVDYKALLYKMKKLGIKREPGRGPADDATRVA